VVSPNIKEFLANIDRHSGPAKMERFYVQITPPATMINSYASFMRDLTYQAESSSLPAIQLETNDYRIYGYSKKNPIGVVFSEQDITFHCTNDFYEKPFFEQWIDYINPAGSGYDFNYKTTYVGTIGIFQLDQQQNIIYGVNLVNAFPFTVREMPLAWNEDSIHKLTVGFYYDVPQPTLTFGSIINSIGSVIAPGVPQTVQQTSPSPLFFPPQTSLNI
jgi:hypothetical protein